MKKLTFVILLLVSAFNSFAQNQDVNPYMGMWYADHSNYRMYGADVLTRTTRAAAEARTNVIKGDHCYDTLAQEILLYNGSAWVSLAESGGGTLDQSYDFGGAGNGREIIADAGAVKISGTDGLLVTGTFNEGDAIDIDGANEFCGMYFNPRKAAFRAGYVDSDVWDNSNVGQYSLSIGQNSTASGFESASIGGSAIATGDEAKAIGFSISAESYAETVIGLHNTDYTPTSTTVWEATDRLFVIGNGQSSGTRSDALIITKNGNLTMPTTTGAFSPPVMTTTERNALTPTAGMIIYNSNTSRHEGYDGTNWNAFY